MQISLNAKISNVSNSQFKGAKRTAAKKAAGLVMAATSAEAAILSRPLYEAKKQQLLYNPENSFANKPAENSAKIIEKFFNKRDKEDLVSMHDLCGKPWFNSKDIANNESLFNEYPWVIKDLWNIKHSKYDCRRFNPHEVLYLAETYKENPSGVKELLEMKTNDNNSRFKLHEVVALAEIYKEEPDTIKGLAKIGFSSDYHTEYLSVEDIKKLLKFYKQNPKAIEEIATTKNKDCESSFFYKDEFVNIAEACAKYPDIIKQFIEKDKTNGYILGQYNYGILAEPYSKYPKTVDMLIKINFGDSKFIANIAGPFSKYPQEVIKLKEMKTEDGNGYRFDNKSVCIIANEYVKDPDFINKIIEMKTPKEALYRFDAKSVCQVAEEYNKNPEYVKKLVEMKTPDGKIYRFDGNYICNFAKKGEKCFDAINELAAMEDENGNSRFAPKAIYYLTDTYTQYPDAVKKLAEMKKKDNKFYLFSYKDIAKLAEWYTKYPDKIQEIINKNNNAETLSAEKIIKAIK